MSMRRRPPDWALDEKIAAFLSPLTCEAAVAQLREYKATDTPRAGENIAQHGDYHATFPAADSEVKAAWVTYDRGQDFTRFYSDPEVLAF